MNLKSERFDGSEKEISESSLRPFEDINETIDPLREPVSPPVREEVIEALSG